VQQHLQYFLELALVLLELAVLVMVVHLIEQQDF
jgi:hypothetical protein